MQASSPIINRTKARYHEWQRANALV
jgi:hypothetical protein